MKYTWIRRLSYVEILVFFKLIQCHPELDSQRDLCGIKYIDSKMYEEKNEKTKDKQIYLDTR
jgi:hypothetical protein